MKGQLKPQMVSAVIPTVSNLQQQESDRQAQQLFFNQRWLNYLYPGTSSLPPFSDASSVVEHPFYKRCFASWSYSWYFPVDINRCISLRYRPFGRLLALAITATLLPPPQKLRSGYFSWHCLLQALDVPGVGVTMIWMSLTSQWSLPHFLPFLSAVHFDSSF